MAHPFIFHFKPGPNGRVEAMYMLDLDCVCGLCGHEQFQRFYHATSFHELTVVGLEKLADGAVLKAGYECENCGEAVGANQVRHSCLTFGFADDAGVIRIFDDVQAGERRVELTANRRLDPQAVPRWQADEDAFVDGHHVVDELDETVVQQRLDRPFNVKLAWRDLLVAQFDNGVTGVCERIGDGLWAVVAADLASAEALADECRRDAHDEMVAVRLDDSFPKAGEPMEGHWRTWLPDRVIDAIDAGEMVVVGCVSPDAAVKHLERTFDVARLDYERTDGDDVVFEALTTPTESRWDEPIRVESVLRRAVHTGLTPGEAARLAAEEVVGRLLQVWPPGSGGRPG